MMVISKQMGHWFFIRSKPDFYGSFKETDLKHDLIKHEQFYSLFIDYTMQ